MAWRRTFYRGSTRFLMAAERYPFVAEIVRRRQETFERDRGKQELPFRFDFNTVEVVFADRDDLGLLLSARAGETTYTTKLTYSYDADWFSLVYRNGKLDFDVAGFDEKLEESLARLPKEQVARTKYVVWEEMSYSLTGSFLPEERAMYRLRVYPVTEQGINELLARVDAVNNRRLEKLGLEYLPATGPRFRLT